jgi:MFS family permease
MNTTQFALVSSIYTLGGLLGALSAGPICNKYGRLLCMRLTALFFAAGPAFESLASSIGLLSFGRFVSGIGAGAAIVVVPIYISELAPPRGKGLFGAFTQVMINLGILVTQFLGYFLSTESRWRIILASAGGIAVLQMAGLFFVPESPKWLAEHSNPQRAREILGRIRGHKVNLDAEVKAWKNDSSAEDICTGFSLFFRSTLLTYSSGGRISSFGLPWVSPRS